MIMPNARQRQRRKVVCLEVDEDLLEIARAEGLSIAECVRRMIDEEMTRDKRRD